MNSGLGVAVGALVIAGTLHQAVAEIPLERGRYLMSSIVACGNCHTPQGRTGRYRAWSWPGDW